MSRLFVVRHGQARFLTDDYDRLSELGREQSLALGRAWLDEGVQPVQVYTGTLLRQRATAEAVADTFATAGAALPDAQTLPGLDEYPGDALLETYVPLLSRDDEAVAASAAALDGELDDRARYRHVHRLLEAVMQAWIGDRYPDVADGLPSWRDFSGGVRGALQKILADTPGGSDVAVFTSGGPVGIAVQTVLDAPDLKAAELNWRVHNASVTRFTFSGRRISLDTFNDVAHLGREMRTYR